jgi:hypothetical protein
MIEIIFTPREKDERSPLRQIGGYDVNYQTTVNGKLYEMEFIYDTFIDTIEPMSFTDDETQAFYDEFSDDIITNIINYYNTH